MRRPLPLSSLDRSTLVPGEVSINSTEGMGSPTLTIFTKLGWNEREKAGGCWCSLERVWELKRALSMSESQEEGDKDDI